MSKNLSRRNKLNSQLETALTDIQAADFLSCTTSALRKWRLLNKGPAYIKVGRLVRYLPEDLRAYMITNRVETGSGDSL